VKIRNTQFTGTNRCWPCTAVNLAVIGAVAGTVAVAWSGAATAVVVGVGLVVLWTRGYVIPGTPRLARHLPDRVLRSFGKEPSDRSPPTDVTRALREAGMVKVGDLRLEDAVRPAYEGRASKLVDDSERLKEAVVEAFDSVESVSNNRALGGGENWFAKDGDGNTVMRWEARALAAMDVAGEEMLVDRLPGWEECGSTYRHEARAVLRRAVSTCPACSGELVADDGPRVACCGGRSLVGTARCPECAYTVVDANDLPAANEDRPAAGIGSVA